MQLIGSKTKESSHSFAHARHKEGGSNGTEGGASKVDDFAAGAGAGAATATAVSIGTDRSEDKYVMNITCCRNAHRTF
jgi:hypothetical protein